MESNGEIVVPEIQDVEGIGTLNVDTSADTMWIIHVSLEFRFG